MRTKGKILNTAGRLIGGILLGLLGYIAFRLFTNSGGTVTGGIPESAHYIAAGCLFFAGYRDLGGLAGLNNANAAATGVRSTVLGVVIACTVFAILLMFRSFAQGQYLDPYKAVFDWIRLIFDLFVQAVTSPVMLPVLVIGGAISGILVAKANQNWR
ncbi:MAG: TrgA family protein [Pseudomonadota bacterium]